MGKICENCGYERKLEDIAVYYECPKCHVVYSKKDGRNSKTVPHQLDLESIDLSEMRVVAPESFQSKAQFPEKPIPFIYISAEGINLNRGDLKNVALSSLILVSAFSVSFSEEDDIRLLFFIRGELRPFVVNIEKIRFAQFPNVAGEGILISLKNFICYLYAGNRRLAVDSQTYAFLAGTGKIPQVDTPFRYARHINSLGSALEKELKAATDTHIPDEAQKTNNINDIFPKSQETEKIIPPKIKNKICPSCGYERRIEDTAPYYECPGCGIHYSESEKNKKWNDAIKRGREEEKENQKEIKNRNKIIFDRFRSQLLFPFIKYPRYTWGLLAALLFIISVLTFTKN